MTAGRDRLVGIVLVLAVAALAVAVIGIAAQPDGGAPASGRVAASPPAATVVARVEHVIDGDTIVVELDGRDERVRYIGIDAPEMAHPDEDTAAECWADDALAANRALVDGQEVALERDVSDRDRFGRLLRHVWVEHGDGWVLVGEQLVARGHAEARTYRPDTGRDAMLMAAEDAAREAGLGLWGSC